MAEFGKSLLLEEQQQINGVLSEAEDFFKEETGQKIEDVLAKMEEAANQLTNALMAMV